MTKQSKPLTAQNMSARDQMMLRCFEVKQRDTILQTLRYALRVKSAEALPKAFQVPVAVALKPGSWDELAARFNLTEDKTDPRRSAFESAMRLYSGSSQYGHALLTCEQLYSIDMEPAGPPGDAERERGLTLTGQPPRKGSHLVSSKANKAESAAPVPKSAKRGAPGSDDDAAKRTGGPSEARAKTDPASTPDRTTDRPPVDPMRARTFNLHQIENYRAQFCEALAVAEPDLPKFLALPFAVPLKIGTYEELINRFNLQKADKSRQLEQMRKMLRLYCRCSQYQHAMLNSDTRFSIDMKPDTEITEEMRDHAVNRLRSIANRNRRHEERLERIRLRESSDQPAQSRQRNTPDL